MQLHSTQEYPDRSPDAPVVECRDVHKAFGHVSVLKGVDLALRSGTVTALVGENGAGKSTLMKIIAGQEAPSAGEIRVGEKTLRAASVREAREAGIAIVPQELAPIPDMTIYENLFLGRELKGALGLLDRSAMIAEAGRLLREFELVVDPRRPMRELSLAVQQIVEIIKSTSTGCDVLLLDEPTSAISEVEVARLYRIIDRLRERGVAMIYTTHKMEEIRAVADRVVVLRDGNLIEDRPAGEITDDQIVTAMIGRDLDEIFPEIPPPRDEAPRLLVADIEVEGFGTPVSFSVRPGEIVALAGLVGAGRTELIETIMGIRRRRRGSVTVSGRAVRRNDPAAAIGAHMAIVPEDRQVAGLVPRLSILENGILPRLSRFSVGGWKRTALARSRVTDVMNDMRLRSASLDQPVAALSGGNQQKVVLGRWLTDRVDVLLLDEPTRGVDVGARSQIYRIIADLASSGMAIVMASSDLPEVLGLAHRVLVMRRGRIERDISLATTTATAAQEEIFSHAAGFHASPR
ncbi:sugar ABC transporter ATP-binding protein [Acrocarpospora catenulata]|uniref:sugar ABC transporter ATP-binding protein n=1 Tax=Acrocarpospora catenulata TaxID=2836182 RepID=UPI001BDB2870|nr:sugar ABC transporter ATP-binding protein [Acrocarpospora catenulata]